MANGNIVVINCVSSGINYIADIRAAGFEPILLEPYCADKYKNYARKYYDRQLEIMLPSSEKKPKILQASEDYDKTLDIVKNLNPAAVIAGSDGGIELATKISHDLGLLGNDPEILPYILNKYRAQECLKRAGVRCIESRLVSSYDEMLEFFNEMQKKGRGVVVKPVFGNSSFGVYICKNIDELEYAYKVNSNGTLKDTYSAGTGKILVQECIEGQEYIVNSVSSNGVHKITMFATYSKRIIPKKGKIYDIMYTLHSGSELTDSLAKYQLSVLDALSIKYGPVHSEIMVDEEGPVLIEANCRLCGGNIKSEYAEELLGIHESKLALDTFLHDDCFKNEDRLYLFENRKLGLMKDLILKKPSYIYKMTLPQAFSSLSGYRYYTSDRDKGFFAQTVDLKTAVATVFFVCKDQKEYDEYVAKIHEIEDKHPKTLYKKISSLI